MSFVSLTKIVGAGELMINEYFKGVRTHQHPIENRAKWPSINTYEERLASR